MVVAQKLKTSEITEQDSLLLTRNLLRIAVFNISYIRGLFPEKYFNDKSVPALEMKIKKLMPMDAESRRLIDWMEKGVYDALQKKYLKTLLFCISESIEGPMIEEYSFSFSYPSSDSQEVAMNFNRTGNKKQGGTFKCNSTTEITPNQMRSSACKMVRTLVQLMRTLDKMPDERTILMKLLYYDDVTPIDYEPPFFRGCTAEETHNTWIKNPLRMEVGNVNSKHFVLALKVKSVLDPCEDENDDIEGDDVSMGDESVQRDESSESDSEVNQSGEDHYELVAIEKNQQREDAGMADEDDTQDPEEDEQQLGRIKEWISSLQIDTVEVNDVLSTFPDISVVMIEETMGKLVEEGILSRTGKDTYAMNKKKISEFEFPAVKEEMDRPMIAEGAKTSPGSCADHMYMTALYHALPMEYVTVPKLQNKLEGEANQNTVRKLIDKMAKEGYLETKSNRRLGKRVIRSDMTEKKLTEVKKALKIEAMDIDITKSHNKSDHAVDPQADSHTRDMSTCGAVHSIGSDLTRTKDQSNILQNGSQTTSKAREQGNTPTSRAEPVDSRESFTPGIQRRRAIENPGSCDEDGAAICSKSSQEKRSRKTSTVSRSSST